MSGRLDCRKSLPSLTSGLLSTVAATRRPISCTLLTLPLLGHNDFYGHFSYFAFAFLSRLGFRRATMPAPLRSTSCRSQGTCLPLFTWDRPFTCDHPLHSQNPPRSKGRFQPIKRQLAQTFEGYPLPPMIFKFSPAPCFVGRGQPPRWPIWCRKGIPGTDEHTNQVKRRRGGAFLIGNCVRKRDGPRTTKLRFDW